MTLREQVLALTRERGDFGVTYPEAVAALPHWAKKHIRSTLHNLTRGGYLRCEAGGGAGRGREPGRYFIRPVPVKRVRGRPVLRASLPSYPVSSPWNMAAGIDVECWPPKFDGGRVYQQLGPWNAPDPMEAA